MTMNRDDRPQSPLFAPARFEMPVKSAQSPREPSAIALTTKEEPTP